jgi:hypothetical protein
MRKQAFDWVIDLQGLARSGAFAWLPMGNLPLAWTNLAKALEDFTIESCRDLRFTRTQWIGISGCFPAKCGRPAPLLDARAEATARHRMSKTAVGHLIPNN